MKAIIAGTFDPITTGHEALIKKASAVFDEVVVLVCQNFDKVTLLTPEQRLELVRLTAEAFPNVRAEEHKGWLYEYLNKSPDSVLFKGIRNSRDLEYEKEMARFNYSHSGVETIFSFADEDNEEISSTLVRSLIKDGGDWKKFIPQNAQKTAEYFYKNI